MDIKDWILIGGGALLLAVVAHGFWLALRNRNGTLRMAIDQNLPRDDYDELDSLRSELPNGGAYVRSDDPAYTSTAAPGNPAKDPTTGFDDTDVLMTPMSPNRNGPGNKKAAKVKILAGGAQSSFDLEGAGVGEALVTEQRQAGRHSEGLFSSRKKTEAPEETDQVSDVDELIIINVFGLNKSVFQGSDLVEVFMRNGMKYGFMSIFHRMEPMTKSIQFSVASALEPGCFELSEIDTYQTPGVSLFLRLPGPQNAIRSFEDMLTVARDIARTLGGDLRDESMSVMTAQTIEHCRLRIHDHARKRMSRQA